MIPDNSPEEPHYRSELSVLSPASPKPLHFPTPTNIPVLNNMMDVEYNQTELHMQNPAMRNTELRDGAWKEADAEVEDTGESSPLDVMQDSTATDAVPATLNTNRPEETTQPVPENVPVLTHTPTTVDHASRGSIAVTTIVSDPTPPDQKPQTMIAQPTTDESSDIQQEQMQSSVDKAASQPPAMSKPDLTTDADAFLSQIQNTALPSVPDTQAMSVDANNVKVGADLDAAAAAAAASTSPQAPNQLSEYPKQVEVHNAGEASLQSTTDPLPHQTIEPSDNATAQTVPPNPAEPTGSVTSNPPSTISLASLFPSGTLPADLAASLMHGTSLPFTSNTATSIQSTNSVSPLESRREQKLAAGEILSSDDEKWTADVQQKYDEFIQDERRYVNEGRWDSFPQGSRLFVGNLSSESVTKRDIFHVFHPYGRLAQISIKQAFGFVQFLNADDCMRALDSEQGRSIKDKKIHLEISKPQKPRNQGNNRDRRSRSPESRASGRADRYSGGRNDPRSYRSPSPRGSRSDDRFGDRWRARSRSPVGMRHRRYDRSPSPRRRDPDDDLPLPKRAPQDVPEVQVLVIDNLDREFIGWVEKAFASRGIRVAVLLLSPRLDEHAVVRRQILEGVLAVSKLTRTSQNTGKIDLQIFDRRGGQSNVRFEEYSNLDPATCAELVLRARSTHAAPAPVQYGYGASPNYVPPSAPPAQYGYSQPAVTPQYNAAPSYAPSHANQPQYSYQPVNSYGQLKPIQQGSAPPQLVHGGYPPFGAPQTVQPVGYPSNPGSVQPMMPQQPAMPGPLQGAVQGAPVDMQQILARLGNYNK